MMLGEYDDCGEGDGLGGYVTDCGEEDGLGGNGLGDDTPPPAGIGVGGSGGETRMTVRATTLGADCTVTPSRAVAAAFEERAVAKSVFAVVPWALLATVMVASMSTLAAVTVRETADTSTLASLARA